VWKCFFAQLSKEEVRLNNRPRFLIRLDEEFAVVYDPQPKRTILELTPDAQRVLTREIESQ
jgi:hypothetical protein